MATTNEQHDLAELLAQLSGSLLQYVDESWSWAATGTEDVRDTVEAAAARQRNDIQAIVDCLDADGVSPEFGTYPTSFTDLHYIDIAFLLKQLVADHAGKAELVHQATQKHPELLSEIDQDHQQILTELKKLAVQKVGS